MFPEFSRKHFRVNGLRFWSGDKVQETRQGCVSQEGRTFMQSYERDQRYWEMEGRGGEGMSTTGSTAEHCHLSPSGTRRASCVRLNVFRPDMFKELLIPYFKALLVPSQKYKHFLRALGGQVRYQKTRKKCKHGV